MRLARWPLTCRVAPPLSGHPSMKQMAPSCQLSPWPPGKPNKVLWFCRPGLSLSSAHSHPHPQEAGRSAGHTPSQVAQQPSWEGRHTQRSTDG